MKFRHAIFDFTLSVLYCLFLFVCPFCLHAQLLLRKGGLSWTASADVPVSHQCTFLEDTDYDEGPVGKTAHVNSRQECCDACNGAADCAAGVLFGSTCYFKRPDELKKPVAHKGIWDFSLCLSQGIRFCCFIWHRSCVEVFSLFCLIMFVGFWKNTYYRDRSFLSLMLCYGKDALPARQPTCQQSESRCPPQFLGTFYQIYSTPGKLGTHCTNLIG